MLFICFLITCRAVEISLILFIYLDALCAGFSKKKKKCSFGETRFCFSFSEGGAEPPAGFWAPLWSDTDPQWRPGSRRLARPERRPLPPAQRPQLPESWGWGHADVWIGGPAFAPHRAGGGLPVEKRQAPLLRACASSFLPYLPKVKPQKEREKRKEKQDSLGQISPKLRNGSVEGPDPWEEALFGQTL